MAISVPQLAQATQLISANIAQRGAQLVNINTLLSTASRVEKLKPEEIANYSQTLSAMLDATAADHKALVANREKVTLSLGTVESQLMVGDNDLLARARAENKAQLQGLLPLIDSTGKNTAALALRIKAVQAKLPAGVPEASSFCGCLKRVSSLFTLQNAFSLAKGAAYVAATAFVVTLINGAKGP
jgi:hypothetical protein